MNANEGAAMYRLEHANLSVTDADALTQFICAAFPQFRVRGEGLDHGGRPWRHVGDDAFYVALQTVPGTEVRTPYSNTPGMNHLGWEIDDLDALRERMAAAGYTPNLFDDSHAARRRLYFYDPDGNDWEFVEYQTDDPAQRNDYGG
jgi:catechol 2,3-dioxygenase-like lactoylglutathione lyase family enzyme